MWRGVNFSLKRYTESIVRNFLHYSCQARGVMKNATSTNFGKEGHMKKTRIRFFLMPLFLLLACVGAFAQANSEVTGTVTDSTGSGGSGGERDAYRTSQRIYSRDHQRVNRLVRLCRIEPRQLQPDSHCKRFQDVYTKWHRGQRLGSFPR